MSIDYDLESGVKQIDPVDIDLEVCSHAFSVNKEKEKRTCTQYMVSETAQKKTKANRPSTAASPEVNR